MKKKSILLTLLAAIVFIACDRDVVPLPTSIEHFTVSSSKRVKFSKGNLQYHPASGQWRMAEAQHVYLGDPLYDVDGWEDYFHWNPEGWSIGEWRTLSSEEWHYLLTFRTNAPKKRGLVSIEGINGLALLPDGWKRPSGILFYADAEDYSTNAYTFDEWAVMEKAGAIFLPAAGHDLGERIEGLGTEGYYWSTTSYDDLGAWNVAFHSAGIGAVYGHNKSHGYSVRLVRED